jgi:tRNA G46 methylase TrmB
MLDYNDFKLSKAAFVKLIPITSPRFLAPETLVAMPDWQQVFGNDNQLVVEIGCGVGDFAAQMATLHPQWNYLALDYYNKGCLKTCKRADKAGLDNLRVVRDEARTFMERCIPRKTLRADHQLSRPMAETASSQTPPGECRVCRLSVRFHAAGGRSLFCH